MAQATWAVRRGVWVGGRGWLRPEPTEDCVGRAGVAEGARVSWVEAQALLPIPRVIPRRRKIVRIGRSGCKAWTDLNWEGVRWFQLGF